MDYVGGFCCLSLTGLVGVLVLMYVVRSRRRRWGIGDRMSAVCIQCRGTGWTQQQQRTLDFTGEGFADGQPPAQTCPACGGTGRVTR
jgi:hypothetical protein